MADVLTAERRGPIVYVTLTHGVYERPAECAALFGIFEKCVPADMPFPWLIICFTAVRILNDSCLNALRHLADDCNSLGGHVAAYGLTASLRCAFADDGLAPQLLSVHNNEDDARRHFTK